MLGGEGTLDGFTKKLVPLKNYASKPHIRDIYEGELPFKLHLETSPREIAGSIEGTFIYTPFETRLIG